MKMSKPKSFNVRKFDCCNVSDLMMRIAQNCIFVNYHFVEPLRVEPGACWEWQGYRDRKGYGQIRFMGKTYWTHRLAYGCWNGRIPYGMHVHHRCFNTRCCNPRHLVLSKSRINSGIKQSSSTRF